jgi:hypothetical protein
MQGPDKPLYELEMLFERLETQKGHAVFNEHVHISDDFSNRLKVADLKELTRSIEHLHGERTAWCNGFADRFREVVRLHEEESLRNLAKVLLIDNPAWHNLSQARKGEIKRKIEEMIPGIVGELLRGPFSRESCPTVDQYISIVGDVRFNADLELTIEIGRLEDLDHIKPFEDCSGHIDELGTSGDDLFGTEPSPEPRDQLTMCENKLLEDYEMRAHHWSLIESILRNAADIKEAEEERRKRDNDRDEYDKL